MQQSRKQFLHSSALLVGATIIGDKFGIGKDKHLIAFSTLGCPGWTFQQIVDFARNHNYHGIELRGLGSEMYLPKCPEFNNANIEASVKLMKQSNLKFVDLGSSCTLHFAEGAEREKNIAEGKAYIDLAQQIGCPNVRVFPNLLPKDRDKDEVMDFIVKGLLELGSYAKASGVKVLLETHGDVVWTQDIEKIMKDASHPNVGLVWDITNMWTITKEPPAEAYRILKKFIHHTHIKDAKLTDGKLEYTRIGQGDVPLAEAIGALANGGYKGFYSFEWEKRWHPELEEPETVLPSYPQDIKKFFN